MTEHQEIIEYAIKQFRDETLMDPDVEQFQTHLKEFTVSKDESYMLKLKGHPATLCCYSVPNVLRFRYRCMALEITHAGA